MDPINDKELYKRITKGIRRGVARALMEHKKAGQSIYVCKNGRIEKIPPEKMKVKE